MSDNRFRPVYRDLTEAEKTRVSAIKDTAEVLARLIECKDRHDLSPSPRMCALAVTNLEQTVMWAVKAITG